MKRITDCATLLLIAVVVLTNVHCQKEAGTGDIETANKTELLTSGQWRVSALTVTPGIDLDFDGDLDTDFYSFFEECDKDDYYVFRTDGTYESNQGATKCDPDAEQSESGTWTFTDNETKFIMDSTTLAIDELTNNRFRISASEAGQTLSMTFSK
jgi:hypothetical protein